MHRVPDQARRTGHGEGHAQDADARCVGNGAVAEFRHRPQAAREGQGLRRRPARPARALVRDAQGLLEGRHRRRVRLRRRRDPALHRGEGRVRQADVPRRRRVPHAARHAARRHALQHRRAPQAGRRLGEARLGPHRVPRPVRRHHVPGRHQRERAAGVRRDQRARLRLGRRRPGGAHLDVLRRRRALRAVVLRRGARAPRRDQQLPRRHPPPLAAVQVQVQVLGLPERLHELDPARGHGGDRHLARQHPHRRDACEEVVREARHERAGQRRRRPLPDEGDPAEGSEGPQGRRRRSRRSPSATRTASRSRTATACAACTAST